jgi:hypothetical protein
MLLTEPAAIQHQGRKLWCHGNCDLRNAKLHAVLFSKACPGEKIIEAIDIARRWRAENHRVIGYIVRPVTASKSRDCREGHTSGPYRWLFAAARTQQ